MWAGALVAVSGLGLAPQDAVGLSWAGQELPTHVGSPAIDARELEGHVMFLASDELEGRETGSAGSLRAADYIARELALAGLEAGGAEGGFFQRVPLERAHYAGAPALEARMRDGNFLAGEYGADFRLRYQAPVSAVFEVRVVASAEDLPASERPDVALFFGGTRSSARKWLAEAGQGEGAEWGLLLFGSRSSRGRALAPPKERLGAPTEPGARRAVEVTLRGDWVEAFRAGRVAQVKIDIPLRTEPVDAFNLVGLLRARPDSPTAHEAVVFTAHYDHIGLREPATGSAQEDEDLVYNGADDDASGVAFVLELAEALAAEGPPARNLLFLLVTGEERGLLGTHHYLRHPLHPLESTVCNLNFEMVGRPDDLSGGSGHLWLTGWERTNLGARMQALGLTIVADARPDQRFFQRSDNYPFAKRGVVAQTLSSYDMHEDYHRVTDEAELLDYEHMQAAARNALAAARALADGSLQPEWSPGGRPE